MDDRSEVKADSRAHRDLLALSRLPLGLNAFPVPVGADSHGMDVTTAMTRACPGGFLIHREPTNVFGFVGGWTTGDMFLLDDDEVHLRSWDLLMHEVSAKKKSFNVLRGMVRSLMPWYSYGTIRGWKNEDIYTNFEGNGFYDTFERMISPHLSGSGAVEHLRDWNNQISWPYLVIYTVLVHCGDIKRVDPDEFIDMISGDWKALAANHQSLALVNREGRKIIPDLRALWITKGKDPGLDRARIDREMNFFSVTTAHDMRECPPMIAFNCRDDGETLSLLDLGRDQLNAWMEKHSGVKDFYSITSVRIPVIYQHYGRNRVSEVVHQLDHTRIKFISLSKIDGRTDHSMFVWNPTGSDDSHNSWSKPQVKIHPLGMELICQLFGSLNSLIQKPYHDYRTNQVFEYGPKAHVDKSHLYGGPVDYTMFLLMDLGFSPITHYSTYMPQQHFPSDFILCALVAAVIFLKSGAALSKTNCVMLKPLIVSDAGGSLLVDKEQFITNLYYICYHILGHSGLGRALLSRCMYIRKTRSRTIGPITVGGLNDIGLGGHSAAKYVIVPYSGDAADWISRYPIPLCCEVNGTGMSKVYIRIDKKLVKTELKGAITAISKINTIPESIATLCSLYLQPDNRINAGEFWNLGYFFSSLIDGEFGTSPAKPLEFLKSETLPSEILDDAKQHLEQDEVIDLKALSHETGVYLEGNTYSDKVREAALKLSVLGI